MIQHQQVFILDTGLQTKHCTTHILQMNSLQKLRIVIQIANVKVKKQKKKSIIMT